MIAQRPKTTSTSPSRCSAAPLSPPCFLAVCAARTIVGQRKACATAAKKTKVPASKKRSADMEAASSDQRSGWAGMPHLTAIRRGWQSQPNGYLAAGTTSGRAPPSALTRSTCAPMRSCRTLATATWDSARRRRAASNSIGPVCPRRARSVAMR